MTFKVKDYYFKKAKKDNFLARSIYKLEEIDQKYKVVQVGNKVLDLGYHPGSWTQYLSEKTGKNGLVVGIDIKEVNDKLNLLENVSLYKKDIFEVKDIHELGVEDYFDVVASDMAPNTTGIKDVDQARSLNLVEMIFTLLPQFLKQDGNLVVKVFDSQDAQNFLKTVKHNFKQFDFLKPKSTRSISKEFFVIGRGFRR